MNILNIQKILFSAVISTGIMCSSAVAGGANNFDDVNSNHQYFDAINWVYNNNIAKGYTVKGLSVNDQIHYKPDNTITRAEFVKMLLVSKYARWAIDADGNTDFSDVYGNEWFAELVDFAQQKNIIKGYNDGTFRPNDKINFAEASKIIALLHLSEDVNLKTKDAWWKKYKDAFEKNNVSVYSPEHLITRGEMADFLFDIYGTEESDAAFSQNQTVRELELETILLRVIWNEEYENSDEIVDEDPYSTVKFVGVIGGKDFYQANMSIPHSSGMLISFYDNNGNIEIVGEEENSVLFFMNKNSASYKELLHNYKISFGANIPDKYKLPENLEISGLNIDNKTFIPFQDNNKFEINPYLLKTELYSGEHEIFTDALNALVIRTGDFVSHKYSISVPFLEDNQIAGITWDNNIRSGAYDDEYRKGYTYQDQGGCGNKNYASIVYDDEKVGVYKGNENNGDYKWKNPIDIYIKESDLKQSGTGKNGENILEFTDTNHVFLKNMYENKYFDYDDKISYEEFLLAHPVFFWKDNFGRLIKFEANRFIPQAECGKPVVYLYPETETQVHVSVAPKGGFSITIPEHGKDGWDVIAQPNGDLTEIKTGEKYPYLFWEGKGGIYESPNKGWVIQKSQADIFVAGKLTQFGFNTQEITDFLEFWSPRMQAETQDYLFISFWGTQYMNKIAPISISPEPDSILRVLMDYKAVPEFYEVTAPKIRKFKRTGFTVTEWGGTLERK
ncbi:TPA: S-layer homology domain-containing protein [Candidatus Gracilibacteria bacterium]|nr:S-layer homology domain-containing protein [Candidatus Gracilibacteria bacterium]